MSKENKISQKTMENASAMFGDPVGNDAVFAINSDSFDIAKREFSDTGIECCEAGGGVLTIHNPELTTNLDKSDAIAIAAHFKLTADDLK